MVDWKPIVAARFRKKEPAVQALDMVLEHGGFSEDEAEELRTGFSLTSLRRVMESKEARAKLGLTVEDGRLHTTIPGSELLKPLKKIITDIANKEVDSRKFNKANQIIAYLDGFNKADRPDLSKRGVSRPVEGIQKTEFVKAARQRTRRKVSRPERRSVVPKGCSLNVTDNRIGEIYEELRTLRVAEARNAIAVLMRVFLELSVDSFLEHNGGSVSFQAPNGSVRHKKLDKKLAEVVAMLIKIGVPAPRFANITRSLSIDTSPMHIDLFHRYIHDRFATPSPGELTAAWDHAQPLFESIWAVP